MTFVDKLLKHRRWVLTQIVEDINGPNTTKSENITAFELLYKPDSEVLADFDRYIFTAFDWSKIVTTEIDECLNMYPDEIEDAREDRKLSEALFYGDFEKGGRP